MTFKRNRLIRATFTLPSGMLEEVDSFVGRRGRSRYVAEAIARRIRRDRLATALDETAGIMADHPGSMSPDEVVAWVQYLRTEETS